MELEQLKQLITSLPAEQKEALLKGELAASLNKSNLDLVRELMHNLPFEERFKLLKEELKSAGLTLIVGGSNNTTTEISVQIHTAGALEMDTILNAIASRIKTDSSKDNSQTHNNPH